MRPIGTAHTPFKEKFGAPRQPGIAPSARGWITLHPPYDDANALRGLDQCSHLWVIYCFHRTMDQPWSPTVRPPRFGGNQRLGVFATRSMFRPNPIGLSLLRFHGITRKEECRLHVTGPDMVDGTPVLDIKPYVPYADAPGGAWNTLAPGTPELLPEPSFTTEAAEALDEIEAANPGFRALLIETLRADPRPAYHDDPARTYGMHLHHWNIQFRSTNPPDTRLEVTAIEGV